jgi:hypothetical protein
MESIAENSMFQQRIGHFRCSSQMPTSSLHAGFSVATLTDLTPVRRRRYQGMRGESVANIRWYNCSPMGKHGVKRIGRTIDEAKQLSVENDLRFKDNQL